MTAREDYLRGSLALGLSELMPPLLRQSLIADEAFSASLALATNSVITFHPSGASFQRSNLMKAVRLASGAAAAVQIQDDAGGNWTVRFEREQSLPAVVIANGSRAIQVRYLGLLSERLEDRRAMLDAEAARVNLPRDAQERWATLSTTRALTDAEASDFAEDLNTTPIAVAMAIGGIWQHETVQFEVLVPTSAAYYERLVGSWHGQADIMAYAESVLPVTFRDLLAFDADAGLRLSLLLCAHPLAVERLAAESVTPAIFDAVARWGLQAGDAMTRCAILELALLRDDVLEETKLVLAEIAEGLCKPGDAADEDFEILSAVFVFVYGQLSHLKILADKPPFWRRMAAFAQAGLIVRRFATRQGVPITFAQDLRAARARPFVLQVYADMRLGPMWQAEFATPTQLRNEFVGRVVSRAAVREDACERLGLQDGLLGDVTSLKSSVDLFLMLRAGPLEDNVPILREMSGENLAKVKGGLAEAQPTAVSFAPLVNSVFLFRPSAELADMAAAALQRAQYRIEAESAGVRLAALSGLATCAAISRSVTLADAVIAVIRNYRRFPGDALDINDAVRIGSTACASREDLQEWASAMGRLMADFAFQSVSKDEAEALGVYIRDFCQLIPELWAACGPALAAAEAVAA